MNKDNIFNRQNSISVDNCSKLAKDSYNNNINDYYLFNNNFEKCNNKNLSMPDFYMDHLNLRGRPGYGLAEPCVIDEYNSLVKNDDLMSRDKCRNQLLERIFKSNPYIRFNKNEIDINDDNIHNLEIAIKSGTDTNPYKCNKLIMEQNTYNFIPLLNHIKDNVQNADHIIPTKWVNGGENSRNYLDSNNSYKKKC